MKLYNATPHEIVIYDRDQGKVLKTIPPSGFTVRLESAPSKTVTSPFICRAIAPRQLGAPVFHGVNGPEFEPMRAELQNGEAALFVSALVGPVLAKAGYKNIYAPDTDSEGVVRKDGQIVGTTQLVKFS